MMLWDRMAGAGVFDLEQPRFAGMPIHPAALRLYKEVGLVK